MRTRAIYAGSFDPVTNGHIDLVERGGALFDEIVVAVGHNPAKRYRFEPDRRVALVTRCVAHVSNARVVRFEGLLVDAARREGATMILRGLRSASDFDSEFRYGLANRDLSGIETVFLPADRRHLFVSSSLVKEIHSNGGDVGPYVPGPVLEALGSAEENP